MLNAIGIVLIALGILVSVLLHEAGHMGTAKAFGMKVTQYFAGFGPTLWSFRRGETEYGVKAIPAGGFVKIVGMTPQDDDVAPGDEHRAMWRFPVWKRTIVMSAGSVTHFLLGVVLLWALFAFAPLHDQSKLEQSAPVVDTVSACVSDWSVDPATNQVRECVQGTDPASPARKLGLRSGDTITAINGTQITSWSGLTEAIRAAAGKTITVTYLRDGQTTTESVAIPRVLRPRADVNPGTPVSDIGRDQLEYVGMLGISPQVPTSTAGVIGAVPLAGKYTGLMFENTFTALKKFPEKVPKLWTALSGGTRDPETPISVVGASRIGGELFAAGEWPSILLVLASLNFFVGIFNLLPLLPLDGGHIAIAWFERARGWLYARLRRPDPGRVDYLKLMPVTYIVIIVFGGFTLLTVAADIVNPITLFSK